MATKTINCCHCRVQVGEQLVGQTCPTCRQNIGTGFAPEPTIRPNDPDYRAKVRERLARRRAAVKYGLRPSVGQASSAPKAPKAPKTVYPKPKAQDPRALALVALDRLEDALVAKMQVAGVTDEARRSWERYQKVKRHALGNANDNEAQVALRLGMIELLKLVW